MKTLLRTAVGVVGLAVVALSASTAQAQEQSKYGGRAGISISPDQFVVGGYFAFEDVSPYVRPRPSVDIGFGDNVLTVVLNADVEYAIPATSVNFLPYVGGGIALGFYKFDLPDIDIPGVDVDDTTTEIGLNLYGGIEKELSGFKTVSVELRLGIADIPDFKIMAGLGFF